MGVPAGTTRVHTDEHVPPVLELPAERWFACPHGRGYRPVHCSSASS